MTLEELLRMFEERVQNRFYGKYEGVVTDTGDPLKIGRLKAHVPALFGSDQTKGQTGWALPCAPFGGGKDRGFLFMPEKGDNVWIEFAAGDLQRPIWAGCWWSVKSGDPDNTEVPKFEEPKQGDKLGGGGGAKQIGGPSLLVLRTKQGHTLEFDDTNKNILLFNGNKKTQVWLTDKGEVLIQADKDVKIYAKNNFEVVADKDMLLTAAQNVIITANNIKVGSKDSKEHLVLGDTFSKFFDKHFHPTGVGPSGPAKVTTPWTPDLLSKKHTTE